MLCSAFMCMGQLAQAQESDWRFYAGVGFGNGGDTIASGTIVNTTANTSQPFTIQTGTTTEFRVGADYRIGSRFNIEASVGHSVESPMGTNGSLTFSTTPLEFLGFVNVTHGFRLGAGIRKTYAEMTGTGVGTGFPGTGRYTGTRGSVLEAQYLFGDSDAATGSSHNVFGISLRVVNESFTHDSLTFSGHHYEIGGAYYY